MKPHDSIRIAVRFALVTGLTVSFGLPVITRAAQNSQGAANLGKVTVTGTRIKRTEIEKAQPVLHISRQQIQASGLTSVGQLLQRLSSAGPGMNREFDNGGSGAARIDLRYLGAQRVLVLINGNRLTTGGASGVIGDLGESPDLNTIPTAIIDHIDVLKDGASAVYGTDAIAGVVNIITRKNFNGAEASAYVGGYENHGFDGLTQQYAATLGHSWKRGNVTVNLSYNQSNRVSAGAREISRRTPGTGTTQLGTGLKGRYIFTDPSGNSHDFVLKNPFGTTTPAQSDFKTFQNPQDRNQIGVRFSDQLTPQNRLGAYFQGYYDITDHIRFNSTLIYSDRNSSQGLGNGGVTLEPTFVPRPGDRPLVLAKDNPFNPFGLDLIASNGPNNNITELTRTNPNRRDAVTEDNRLLQYIGGFSGDFSVANRQFDWETSFVYSNDDENRVANIAYNTEHLRRALGSPSQCGPGTVHPNCVPYNLFGPNTPAADQYLFFTGQSEDANSERIYNANISSADIVDLPYGPLGIALGYQHREENAKVIPDSLTLAGLSNENRSNPTFGRFDVNAIYGEINVPLLANLPGAHELGIDVQTRHSNYSTFGGNTSSRAGFRYEPISDLLLRGTWSQGFRAPNILNLFGGLRDNFPAITDPCNNNNFSAESAVVQQRCVAAGVPAGGYEQLGNQIRTEQGGNPNLRPETSISRTLGVVYSPSQVPGLSLNVDYYKIEVVNALVKLPGQDTFNACYLGGNPAFCDAITRGQSGRTSRVLNLERNIASFSTNGYDFGVNYKFPSTPVGDFTVQAHATHVILFNETTPNFNGGGGFSTQKFANTEQGGLSFPDGVPANKANLDLDWSYGNWSAHYHVNFIEGITEDCNSFQANTPYSLTALGLCSLPDQANNLNSKNRLRDTFYHDVQLSYFAPQLNTRFTIGVNNLFDRNPPVSYSAFQDSYDPTLYRVPGRFLYGRIVTRF
jgi:iron complex outermembrane receptor protein